MAGIAVIGSINPEIMTGPVREMPAWGTETASRQTEVVYAGSTARVGFPLRCLQHEVSVFGVVGDDDFGAKCLSELRKWGMNVDGVEEIKGERTCTCIAIVREDAERLLITDTRILAKSDDGYLQRQFRQLSRFDFVLLTGLFEMEGLTMSGARNVFSALRKQGVITLLDTGWPVAGWTEALLEEFYPLLREADFVLPNLTEIMKMTGAEANPEALARSLRHQGANDIYLKLGNRGAACLVGDEFFAVDAIPITPKNTTAAGECFNAGVLHGLALGMGPREVLDFANRLSAHYVATGSYQLTGESWLRATSVEGSGVEHV
jgi:sugar/nucleoside kinase (ribokinase family)